MPKGLAKILGQGFRDKDKLVSQVTRHLQTAPDDDDRNPFCIHPSEMAKGDKWCERATYYRINGTPADPSPNSLAMEMVFETGHDAHHKWQSWLWDMGILWGMWECLWCGLYWWDKSPTMCLRCEVGKDLLKYREVPVSNDQYLIAGQADGLIKKPIEVKSIGPGTVRVEAPALLAKYSYTHIDSEGAPHTGTDWQALWRGIRRPFPSHLKQGMIYCFCAGWSHIDFLYDPKFLTAWPKEFEIKFSKDIIQDVLDKCLLVKDALERQRPPKRPHWATKTCASCKACPYRTECYDSRHHQANRREKDGGQNGAAKEEAAPAETPSRFRFASTPFESDRPARRGRHAAPHQDDPVSGSPRRITR